jgi:hypothetical protein
MLLKFSHAQFIKAPAKSNPVNVTNNVLAAKLSKLVYVYPVANNGDAGLKYIGKLVYTSADSLMMLDFYENYLWRFKKQSDGRLDRTSPDYASAINRIYICNPQGPIKNPAENDLPNRDYAAICLSNGQVIYAKINGFYFYKPNTKNVTPGSSYCQFQEEYGKGKFYQIDLIWDAGLQKWKAETNTYGTNPYIKNGVTVTALFSYNKMSEEFFNQNKQ